MTEDPDTWGLQARLRFHAPAMRAAIEGEATPGTFHAGNWADKPHRVLFDACELIEEAAARIEALEAALRLARDLIDATDQTSFGVWTITGDDPELAVCSTYDAVTAALATSEPEIGA